MLRRNLLNGTLAVTNFPSSGFAFAEPLFVNRTETCGCCGASVERMNSASLKTEVNYFDEKALDLIKSQLDIPLEFSRAIRPQSATIS